MTKKHYKSKNEFRYNKNTKHTNYIFEDDGTDYHAVGVTHKETTFGKKNMPLGSNPQKGKSELAYIRNGIIIDKHKYFDKVRRNFSFSADDLPKVKSKIRNYKKNRRKKKK